MRQATLGTDPKGNTMLIDDQGSQPVELDALAQMEALLDGPDDGQPEDEEERDEESTEEPEESTEEETTEEKPEAAKEPAEETEELTWNGETKQVTKTELKELAQKGFDYTQKTQQLAEERRQAEAQIKVARDSLAIQEQQVDLHAAVKVIDSQLAQFKDLDWNALADQDPVQFLKLNQSYRELKDARVEKINEYQQKMHELQNLNLSKYQEDIAREQKALAAIPEFTGEKAAATKAEISAFLKSEGYTDQEISSVIDHRAVKVAWKAAQWDRLQKSSVQVSKKVAEVPKVVKAGAQKPQVRQADRDTYAQLKKTGRGEYAAKLIEQML